MPKKLLKLTPDNRATRKNLRRFLAKTKIPPSTIDSDHPLQHLSDPSNPKKGRCWHWIGARTSAGFPYFSLHGKAVPAAKAAWLLKHRPDNPDPTAPELRGVRVYRMCKTPDCVNWDHLSVDPDRSYQHQEKRLQRHRKIAARKFGELKDRLRDEKKALQLLHAYQYGNNDFLHLQSAFGLTPEGVLDTLREEMDTIAAESGLEGAGWRRASYWALFESLFPGQKYQGLDGF